MRKTHLTLMLLAASALALASAGCSDKDNGQKPGPQSVWEIPHAQYMLLGGNVATLTEQAVEQFDPNEEPLLFTVLQAEFNSAGQLTFYNPLMNYDPRNPAPEVARGSQPRPRFADWGVASKAWAYGYDTQGRMSHITEYEMGEVGIKEYTIHYGDHGLYVPAPFGVLDRPLWLLRGVTSITGPEEFSLTCDGTTVSIDYPATFMGSKHETYTYRGNYPSQSVSQTTSRGQTTTLTTDYTWGRDGQLLRTVATNDDLGEQTTTQYSTRMPYGPTLQALTENQAPIWTVAWDYHSDGQIAAVRFVEGHNWTLEPYTRSYSEPDAHGNWLRSEKNSDGEILRYVRAITYR